MADTSQRRRFLQCPRCGAENLPTNKFCGQCGANLRGDAPAPAGTTLPSKGGAVLPYSPGARGPGKAARLMIGAVLLLILASCVLVYVYLFSGADHAQPRRANPTPTALVGLVA